MFLLKGEKINLKEQRKINSKDQREEKIKAVLRTTLPVQTAKNIKFLQILSSSFGS